VRQVQESMTGASGLLEHCLVLHLRTGFQDTDNFESKE
jgi:hypothetical protein